MSYLSLNTWSLHRELGPLQWTVWDDIEKKHQIKLEQHPENIKLKDLPGILSSKGFKALEICHFHFQRTDSSYLEELRNAFNETNITFHTLLVDYGNISSEDEVRRNKDMQFIKKWIDIASEVGAQRVRVIAGDAGPEDSEALACALNQLNLLVEYAKPLGVRVVTENFHSLTSKADNCIHLVHQSNQQIRLITDFGNFDSETKYDEIVKMLPFSDSIHAKPNFDSDGIPDKEEYQKSLNLLSKTNYNGPITLIYDGPGDMWAGIDRVKQIVEAYLV